MITLAGRRGACVRVVNAAAWGIARNLAYDVWHQAPFCEAQAIDERERVVYLLESFVDEEEAAGNVLHDLAHLHASKRESVDRADEYSWMGWEIAAAREARVRRAWDLAMRNYGLGDQPAGLTLNGADWGEATRGERLVIIADRLKAARKQGAVDQQGRAVWHRLPRSPNRTK